nr:potassium-transporting ATPase subunit C [Alicyclobacillus sacchari]
MINLWRSLRFLVVSVALLGLIYPLIVTGIGQLLFPYQANGSMVKLNGRVVGSILIAQAVTNPGLFHPRPSAVSYSANGSGGLIWGLPPPL